MGTKFQWGIKTGKIALLVVFLMLVPLRTASSYNTFFKEYDFTFPKNDVIFINSDTGVKKNITLPSIDIIGARVKFNELNSLKVQMMFGGNPYTNNTTIYRFDESLGINSTTTIHVHIENYYDPAGNYHSVNVSLASLFIEKSSNTTVYQYNVTAAISDNTITWLVDMYHFLPTVPISQIFTGASFSNQT